MRRSSHRRLTKIYGGWATPGRPPHSVDHERVGATSTWPAPRSGTRATSVTWALAGAGLEDRLDGQLATLRRDLARPAAGDEQRCERTQGDDDGADPEGRR